MLLQAAHLHMESHKLEIDSPTYTIGPTGSGMHLQTDPSTFHVQFLRELRIDGKGKGEGNGGSPSYDQPFGMRHKILQISGFINFDKIWNGVAHLFRTPFSLTRLSPS